MNRSDAVVVGGGIGGLATAALLQARGISTVLLEARDYVGGCAATFHHDGRASEAGATWLTGLEPGMPLHRLFSAIGLNPDEIGVPERDPMAVFYRQKLVRRWSDPLRWDDELDSAFGASNPRFWTHVHSDAEAQWERSRRFKSVPPQTPAEYRSLLGSLRARDVGLMKGLLSTSTLARRAGLQALMPLMDAQLMITTQSTASHVPWLYGAPGLDFAALPARWMPGGIGGIADRLALRFQELGGHLVTGSTVTGVSQSGGLWQVETRAHDMFAAQNCVLNLVHGAAAELLGGAPGDYFRKRARRFRPRTGACDLHFRIDDRFPHDGVRFFQIVLAEPLPVTGSHSYFVTVSHPDDPILSADGKRTVNVSTHTPLDYWWHAPEAEYHESKTRLTKAILDSLESSLPDLFRHEKESLHAGTPRTFAKFVGRTDGAVGGYPLNFRNLPWQVPGPRTPFDGLWQVGDNVFPGQSIPGTALGALLLAERLEG